MQAVLIAAGESSRFWPLNNGTHKSQVSLMGRPVIYWTLKGLEKNGIAEAVVVTAPGSSIKNSLEGSDLGMRLSFVEQQKPLGTGNALLQAKPFLKEHFVVLWPSKINSHSLVSAMKQKQEEGSEIVLAGAPTDTPEDYGIFKFQGDRVEEIVENPAPGKAPSNVKWLGALLLDLEFFAVYENLGKHHEADLIDTLNLILKKKKAGLVMVEDQIPALKYPWELLSLLDILVASPYFEEGADPSAKIGEHVVIKGPVMIQEGAVIKDHTVIEGPCFIGKGAEIGYHNVLRGPLAVGAGVRTGSYTEIKHSIIQEDAHIHSGYVGDSVIGEGCRIGAGFVTANRRLDRKSIAAIVKGKKKDTGLDFFGTVIGKGTRIGIHAGTMPGTLIGAEVSIGPGTMASGSIEDGKKVFEQKR